MKGSLLLGKISGIKIFIHWTFLILVFWIIMSGTRRGYSAEEILWTLGFILTIFVCITLHELGHALTAKRFKFKTQDITLLPIGGVARIQGLPHKPMQEFLVAIMGPAVNLAIALVVYVALEMTGEFPQAMEDIYITSANFWPQLYAVNIFLALFNLIPAFPMDGGRILRALLATSIPRAKATRIAAFIGQFIAICFVFLGFLYNPILVLIGVFVFIGAQAEATLEGTRELLGNLKAGDILMHSYSELHPKEPLSKAVSIMLDSQERAFIIKDDGEIKGTLSKTEIIEGLSKFGSDVAIENVMKAQVTSLKAQDKINEVMLQYSNGTDTLMPVLEEGKVIGVLNLENIHEFVQIQAALLKSQEPAAR